MSGPGLRRRDWLAAAAALVALPARAVSPVGALAEPEPAPAIVLTDAHGRRSELVALLQGQLSVVQLMFTGCSTVCPTQGLLFAQLAARTRPMATRWISISIDALGDDPARLAAWQAKLGAHPSWLAAVPAPADVDRLSRYLRGGVVRPGTHSAQVFVFDSMARLCLRSANNPSPGEVERLIGAVAAG